MVRLPSYSKTTLSNLNHIAETVGLVLVSGSPRRKRLLGEAGIRFEIIVPELDEVLEPGLAPTEQAMSLARQKVQSVTHTDGKVYLGCDTIVVYENEILTKPTDEADAMRILRFLSGKTHSVFSGLTLVDSRDSSLLQGYEESRVTFNHLGDDDLAAYIATGEPLDKAGAYGIQGMGAFLVDSVEGSIDNVVGLPMRELEKLAGRYREKYV